MRVGRNLASRARLAVCCQSRWSGLVVKRQKLLRDDPVVQAGAHRSSDPIRDPLTRFLAKVAGSRFLRTCSEVKIATLVVGADTPDH
jgi:hypothetical protein